MNLVQARDPFPLGASQCQGRYTVHFLGHRLAWVSLDSSRRSVWAWGALHGFTANRQEQPAFVGDTAFLGKSTGKVPLGPFGHPFASRNGEIGMILYEDNCREHEAYADYFDEHGNNLRKVFLKAPLYNFCWIEI